MHWQSALVLLALAARASATPAFEIEGWGRARAVAGDLVRARAEALDLARREAVGRALRLALETGPAPGAASAAAAACVAVASRYVRALRVIEEQQLDNDMVVRVAVVCDLDRLRRDCSGGAAAPVAPAAQAMRVGLFTELVASPTDGQHAALLRSLRQSALEWLSEPGRGLRAEALLPAAGSWASARVAARQRGVALALRLRVRVAGSAGSLPGLEWPLVQGAAAVEVEGIGPGAGASWVERAVVWGAGETESAAQADAAHAAAGQVLTRALSEVQARTAHARGSTGAALLYLAELVPWWAYQRLCAQLRLQAAGTARCELERVTSAEAQLRVEPAPAGALLAALLAAGDLGEWLVRVDEVRARELWATLVRRAPTPAGPP